MIVNPMYKGVHVYGLRKSIKFSFGYHAPVERKVPAIVEPELWDRAQSALRANQIFSTRNAKTNYLLRGLMKCADEKCGLTYVGLASRRKSGKFEFYYRCNGKAGARGIYGVEYKRCPSKDINGSRAEDLVWSEVEKFLRNPGEVLRQLEEKLSVQANSSQKNGAKIAKLETELKRKDDAKVRLAKREAEGLIDISTWKTATEEIEAEAHSIRFQIEELRNMDAKTEASRAALVTVGSLLGELQKRLDGPLPFEAKRRIVETLVDSVVVETVDYRGKRANRLRVRYKFDPSIVTRKARGSWRPRA
jgi:site-specific DNA recombinase